MTTNAAVLTISRKFYRTEQVTDRDGTYTAFIPCDAKGGNVNRCPICGGHDDHTRGIGCGQ